MIHARQLSSLVQLALLPRAYAQLILEQHNLHNPSRWSQQL